MPALVTPLTSARDVDVAGASHLVERAVDQGATGVLVAGSTGEGTLLHRDQRVALARAARTAAPHGDALVLGGASGSTVDDLHADVAALAAAGVDLVLVLAPHTYPLRDEELVDLHVEVADRADVATLAYHIPQYTGSELTPEAVRELATHPGVVGLKDSSPDAGRRAAFVAATSDADGFAVLSGHVPSLLDALQAGAAGSITGIANVRQRQVTSLHDALADGDEATARRTAAALVRTEQGLATAGASTPAALKAALQLEGAIAERWCRPPLRSVAPDRLDRVRTALMPG
jgi:4-hydroxy-tetrahydrodipicolinate synthase